MFFNNLASGPGPGSPDSQIAEKHWVWGDSSMFLTQNSENIGTVQHFSMFEHWKQWLATSNSRQWQAGATSSSQGQSEVTSQWEGQPEAVRVA